MKMKLLLATALVTAVAACSYSQQKSSTAKSSPKMQSGVSVIELFTSEGCSSCPSADALMPKLQEQYGDKLIILSFHVDYWDRLGWKDAFSSPDWTGRQNQYAAALGADNIYTPQAVVNGTAHIIGSNRTGVQELIGNGISNAQPIELTAKSDGAKSISISYKAALKAAEVINIVLVQRHATTNVRRGENGGRQLQHYNVVRDFKTSRAASGTASFTLPDGISAGDVQVIAFTQKPGNMHISGAAEAVVQ